MSDSLTIQLSPDQVIGKVSPYLTGAGIEDVNHEIYGGIYSQMIFGESFEETPMLIDERLDPAFASLSGTVSCLLERTHLSERSEVCSWQPYRNGSARGAFKATLLRAHRGRQSQKITFLQGEGVVGIENQGLNRWGLNLVAGKPYEGMLVALAEAEVTLSVSLESRNGAQVYARQALHIPGDKAWHTFDFTLTPAQSDGTGRLALGLAAPGTVWIDYVFLQPGPWGRFHKLPVRGDIGQGLVDEGLSVLRYGGYMINTDWEHEKRCPGSGYRWKKALGPRADRPPYLGTFHPTNTCGFGVPEFAAYCQAAGFLCVPTINPSETPADVVDLVEYLNGSVETPWGARRAADGFTAPFGVRYLELGNEEHGPVTENHIPIRQDYPELFAPIFKAVTAKYPDLTLIIAIWLYNEPELDFPENQAPLRKLLEIVHGQRVLWDVHVGGDHLEDAEIAEKFITHLRARIDAIDPKNRVEFCILEENGGLHNLQRALGHAHMINRITRLAGQVVIDCPANCLQAYQQNDHAWDQGQLFYTPGQVWGVPPYYAQQMIAGHYQPLLIRASAAQPSHLDITATRSEDGKTLVVKVVNLGAAAQPASLQLSSNAQGTVSIQTLAGALDADNTPEEPQKVIPQSESRAWKGSAFEHTFPGYSFTVLEIKL